MINNVTYTHPGRNGGGGGGTFGTPGVAYTFTGFGKPTELEFVAEGDKGDGERENTLPCVVGEGGRKVVLCGPLWRRRL